MEEINVIALIRRWLRGEAGAREEQQLEEAAAQDPFLADALMGYRELPAADHPARIEQLRRKLRARRQRRGAAAYWLRVAAAVAVVAIALAGLWRLNRVEEPALALEQVEERSTAPAGEFASPKEAVPSENLPSSPSTTSVPPAATRRERADRPPPASPPPAPAPEAVAEATEEAQPAPPETPPPALAERKRELEAPAAAQALAPQEPVIRREAAPTPTPMEAVTADTPLRRIAGQVLDAEGEPLIGANVQVVGTNRGAVTDFDGRFSLEVQPEAETLDVSYLGFQNRRYFLGDEDSLQLMLSESAPALDEVVVTGLGRKNRSAGAAAPQPRRGWDRLKQYIADNLQYPAAAREQGVEGEVLLRFRIDERGRPVDFEVLRSLGFGCDEEAIRLLRDGPRWQAPTADSVAQYAVPFSFR